MPDFNKRTESSAAATPLPHVYRVSATASPDGVVELCSEHLPFLHSAPPVEFGGPGDRWSPETLLAASVGDCFILTFRAAARAMKLSWTSLRVDVNGTLDRIGRVTQFIAFEVRAELRVPSGTSTDDAGSALTRAEQNCLIANSLKAPVHLHAKVFSTSGSDVPVGHV
jgi:organic hydroperoxide reductase OsmC/OhrA